MKHIHLTSIILALIGLTLQACAQNPADVTADQLDSATFVNTHWRTEQLPGFTYKRICLEGEIFDSYQYMTMLVIPPNSPRKLAFTYVKDTILPTSEMAKMTDAVAAINGSYFDMKYYNPVCYLRIDGKEVGINTPGEDTVNRKYYQYASIRLKDGRPIIFMPDSNRFSERSRSDKNIMTAGPMLLHQGKAVPQRTDRTFVTSRHNRTALGVMDDGTIILLTVDGRFKKQADGMTLDELAKVMRWLGCKEAINLDGGGSTTMFVRGKPNGGIVNHPSDNNRFDYEGERPVSNAILLL